MASINSLTLFRMILDRIQRGLQMQFCALSQREDDAKAMQTEKLPKLPGNE